MNIERMDALLHHAQVIPANVALVDLDTGRQFDYAQLNERVGRVAGFLQQQFGVARGDRVAVLSQNSSDVFEIQFACWRIGAVFVPVNWRLTVPELEYILSDAAPRVLVGDTAFAPVLEELGVRLDSARLVERGAADSDYETLIASARPAATESVMLGETASLIYTSGTTGRPKGAQISHLMELYSYLNYICATSITRDSRALAALPLFHVGGLNCFPNPILYLGGSVLVMKNFEPGRFLQLLADSEQAVTHVFGVPTIFAAMAREPEFRHADFSHLVCAAVGGASVPLPLLDVLEAQGLPVQQAWGMTESTSLGSILERDRARDKLGSAGLPAQHVKMRIADDCGQQLRAGVVGELQVKGPSITRGYWNRPDATEKSFVDGWFRTGDAACLDEEGYLFIVDRWTDMYISGGENVYPAEVESVLSEIDGVVEAAVIGIPDERWGQVGRAFIVRRPGASLSEREVLAHCNGRLARYKIPREVVFAGELPHNAAGKLLKAQLPRTPRAAEPSDSN
ncbi:MAG TPA: long-chain fatty acid--CoA ligase [Burkholderiaceae bacterium]|nr:long-chain fatty acid--CoA ligase [Burkholderiaceae bacterium]